MPKRARTSTDTDTGEDRETSDTSCYGNSKRKGKSSRRTRSVAPKRARASVKANIRVDAVTSTSTHPTSSHVVTGVDALRDSLLHWYDQIYDVRGMPWRRPYDASLDKAGSAQRAYEVWISEIMLQQTQVATVIPYYNKWMAKFPTIYDLAVSDIEVVNGLWKGLGYYSRAARLLRGAQKVVKEFNGRLPDNAKDMQVEIPGIGRYSAGAICSIAYNQCVPVLDGNVIRLLARFLALYAPTKAKRAQDVLWAAAETFVEGSVRPGDVNQALIELGSTVCKVRDPVCEDCPLQPWCRAYQSAKLGSCPGKEEPDIEELCTLCEPLPRVDADSGLVTIYPMKVERKKAREELDCVNVIEWCTADDHKRFFLLVRRPEGGTDGIIRIPLGLLAGLYEFPTLPNVSGISATAANAAKISIGLLKDLMVDPPSCTHSGIEPHGYSKWTNNEHNRVEEEMQMVHVKPAGDVVHVFSHIRKTYRIQWVLLKGGGNEPPKLRYKSASFGNGKSRAMQKGKLRKQPSESSDVGDVQWIPLDQVEHTNIGTGVMKVWRQVQTLW